MKYILTFIFTIGILVAQNSIVGQWYSTDGQRLYSFNFKADGTYSVKIDNGQTKIGKWQANNSIITTTIDNASTKYRYAFNQGYLILALSKNSYVVLGKDRSYFQNLLAKAKNTQLNNQNRPLTNKEFLYLLQNFYKMPPNSVYLAVIRMNKEQQSWIPIYQAWYQMLLFRACQGDLAYKNKADAQMCDYVKAQNQKTMQLLNYQGDPWAYAKEQNSKLIILYKKKLGLINSASFNSYLGAQQNIYNMQNQTTNTIINNIKPLPCTEHYEQGTNAYLGCY